MHRTIIDGKRYNVRHIGGEHVVPNFGILNHIVPHIDYKSAKKYFKDTAYIIGKGPSLDYIDESYFPTNDTIICLNDAYINIEKLNLSNEVFGLQVDHGFHFLPKSGKIFIIKTLVDQFKDAKEIYAFTRGLLPKEWLFMSAFFAVKVCLGLGVKNFNFISFDGAILNKYGSFTDTLVPNSKHDQRLLNNYKYFKRQIDKLNITAKWVTPSKLIQWNYEAHCATAN